MNIYAVDVTNHPGLLLTRKRYHEKNREFIRADNEIRRIFIINYTKLNEPSYAEDLCEVLRLNKDLGVTFKLIPDTSLRPEEIRDFIIYDEKVMIEEGHQVQANGRVGDSYVRFQKDKLQTYKGLFDLLWAKAGDYDPSQKCKCCILREKCCKEAKAMPSANSEAVLRIS